MRLGFVLVATIDLDTRFGFDVPLVLEATVRVGQSDEPETETYLGLPDEIKITPKSSNKKKKDDER
jgi:hypothetical protein